MIFLFHIDVITHFPIIVCGPNDTSSKCIRPSLETVTPSESPLATTENNQNIQSLENELPVTTDAAPGE